MFLKRSNLAFIPVLALLGSVTIGTVGCGGEDDPAGDDDNGDDDDDNGGGGANPDREGCATSGSCKVVLSTDVNMALSGKTVRLYDSETGAMLDQEAESDGSGMVDFENVPDGAGALIVAKGEHVDSYNIPPNNVDEPNLLRNATLGVENLVPTTAGFTSDQDAGAFVASVFWYNKDTQLEDFVGCAVIEVEGVDNADVRYFSSALPTNLQMRSATAGTKPLSGANEAEAGKVYIGNIPAGKQKIVARVNGEVIAELETWIFARKESTKVDWGAGSMGTNLHFGGLFVDNEEFAENPTPPDCQ